MSTTKASKISYVEELDPEARDFKARSVEVIARDWDVTDPDARQAAAEEELGAPLDEHYDQHAAWMIDEERNAAALVVYRPKVHA